MSEHKLEETNDPIQQLDEEDDEESTATGGKQSRERRKIEIRFIQDKSRRHITFSKRKAGIMKKAYELSVLTGTQVLLLVVSETGLVYTFTTPKLQPLVTKPEGKNLIQACLNAPEENINDEQEEQSQSPVPQQAVPVPQQQQPPQQPPQQNVQQQAVVQQQQDLHQLPNHYPHQIPLQQQVNQSGFNLNDQAAVYQQYFANMQGQQGQY